MNDKPRVHRADNGITFRCPGCNEMHYVPTTGEPAWGWNESLTRPTLSPSISIKSGHYAAAWNPGDACWCTYKEDVGFKCYICHSNIVDGRIIFAADCTHALVGHTVDLPDLD